MQDRIRLPRPIEPVRLPPPSELRAWAQEHRLEVGERGAMPQEVCDRYVGYRLRTRRRIIRQSQVLHPSTH